MACKIPHAIPQRAGRMYPRRPNTENHWEPDRWDNDCYWEIGETINMSQYQSMSQCAWNCSLLYQAYRSKLLDLREDQRPPRFAAALASLDRFIGVMDTLWRRYFNRETPCESTLVDDFDRRVWYFFRDRRTVDQRITMNAAVQMNMDRLDGKKLTELRCRKVIITSVTHSCAVGEPTQQEIGKILEEVDYLHSQLLLKFEGDA